MRRFCLGLLFIIIGGCSATYKQAVKGYSVHQVEFARALTACTSAPDGSFSDECIVTFAFPMSGLRCLVDEDEGAKETKACNCSRPKDADGRKTSCTTWLKEGN